MASGIYVIRNVLSGAFYVGSSVDIRQRINLHRSCLRRGVHDNRRLQSEWDAAPDAISFEPICVLSEGLRDAEQRLLDNLYSHPLCVNAASRVDVVGEWTPARREAARMRARRKKGTRLSPEACQRISAAKRARCTDPEVKAREIAKLQNAPNGMLGRRHSAETRAKIAAKAMGRAAWNRGRAHSVDTREKIRQRQIAHQARKRGESWP